MNKKYKKYFRSSECRITELLAKLFGDDVKIVGAEIGVHTGKNSRRMLDRMQNLTLSCVDMWDLHAIRENVKYYTRTKGKISKKMKDIEYGLKCHDAAKEALVEFVDRCHILRASSKEAAEMYDDNYFDFVYVDACHKYKECKRDILTWIPKVKSGGYICGHDWNSKRHKGVRKAVKEVQRSTVLDLVGNKNKLGEWLMGPIV